MIDEDGPEPPNERNHSKRDARLVQNPLDLSWDLTESLRPPKGRLGRARRFTGSARTAATAGHTHCIWPGCHAPASRCDIDHLHEHGWGGPTTQTNSAPLCGKHNRWKQKGFQIQRDPTGAWHTTRPDGSQLE